MKRKPAIILLSVLVVFFAVVLFLFISSLLSQQWEMEQHTEELTKLVEKTMSDRAKAEKLAAELSVKEEKYKKKLEKLNALLRVLQEEEEAVVERQLAAEPHMPDAKEVEQFAANPIPELVAMLQASINASDHLRTSALIAALKSKNEESVDYLIGCASKPESNTKKYYYLLILAFLKDARALPVFQDAMVPGESGVVRDAAATGLMSIPDVSSLPLLLRTLKTETDKNIKMKIVTALGLIGDSRAVEPLKTVSIDEENNTIGSFALTALVRIADPSTVDFFAETARNSTNADRRLIAVIGLKSIGNIKAKAVLKEIAQTKGPIAREAGKALDELSSGLKAGGEPEGEDK